MMFTLHKLLSNYYNDVLYISVWHYVSGYLFLNGELKVSIMTRAKLNQSRREGTISDFQYMSFRQAVITFYFQCATHAKKWFPLSDRLLKNAKFLDLGPRVKFLWTNSYISQKVTNSYKLI